jgi:hypothetical protein
MSQRMASCRCSSLAKCSGLFRRAMIAWDEDSGFICGY